MKIPFNWELISETESKTCGHKVWRAKVIGGWVLSKIAWDDGGDAITDSMVFIPDLEHKWEIK